VSFNPDGSIASEVSVCSIPTDAEGVIGSTAVLAFGDFTFDPMQPGVIYGSATVVPGFSPLFFKMNSDCSGYQQISTADPFGAGALQIAFGLSDGVLYGHSARDGQFVTIDTATGAQSLVCNAIAKTEDFGGIDPEHLKFSDLTEGTCASVKPFDGCTPGYWKNEKKHLGDWVTYSPDDTFVEVFGVTLLGDETLTLLDTLKQGGGGEIALGRHAVAALLNASSPDVYYPYTAADIISLVQDAADTGMFEETKDLLEEANEEICPL
jgi:hypothetical protein